MPKNYDHKKIESKWQKVWQEAGIYQTLPAGKAKKSKKKPCYVLDMFPYPSGAGLHVGHPRGYIGSDVFARMKRMQGYNVLHPMGFDSFGLPAEQYAIQTGKHPGPFTDKLVKQYKKQLEIIGFSYDWGREVATHDPEYYRWTQWIFLKIYDSWYDKKMNKARPIADLIKIFEKHGNAPIFAHVGRDFVPFTKDEWKHFNEKEKHDILMNFRLAYEGYAEVNWCPALGTVLANDEIIDTPSGLVSERGEHPVEKKNMRQWFMRITAYADRLLEDLDILDWPSNIKEIQKNWIGREEKDGVLSYKMRDAIFARQRYWGEPIPLIHNGDAIITPLKEKDLPLELPKVKSYAPSGTGESPLATVAPWVKAGYETNTMPGWAGSSWYFLRYIDPKNKKAFAGEDETGYWFGKNGGVDMYVGGQEHATGHLLYARFWHKVLHDLGYIKSREPFKSLRNQGMIGGADGRKMSKRWGNVVNPDDVVKTYGADSLRVFEMFLGPFDSHLPWSTEGIIGSRRFIERVWRAGGHILSEEVKKTDIDITYALNDAIKKVTEDILDFKFNTAVSAMMIFMGVLEKEEYAISHDDFKKFLQLLAPFAPHVAEELWLISGEKHSIHTSSWPAIRKLKERKTLLTVAVQINGKLRGEVMVPKEANEEEVVGAVMLSDKLRSYLESGQLVRTIFVPMKLINFVVKASEPSRE